MSIVVAVKKGDEVVIAADSLGVLGSNKPTAGNASCTKIRRIGPALLGSVGWAVYDDILSDYLSRKKSVRLGTQQAVFRFFMDFWRVLKSKYSFVNEQNGEEKSPFSDLNSQFLVVTKQRIFFVASDMNVTEYLKFHAMGAGADFSIGALHVLYDQNLDASELASKAVETAIENNIHCGGEIQVRKA